MNNGFTKLYGSIITSTIWLESPETKVVWITMLAMADQFGMVTSSTGGLAKMAGVSVEDCKVALEKFMSPDEDSGTEEHEGRRIEKVPHGWRLLNHSLYRELRTPSQIANAERQRKFQESKKEKESGVTPNKSNAKKRPEADTDPDTDPDTDHIPPKSPKGDAVKEKNEEPSLKAKKELVIQIYNDVAEKHDGWSKCSKIPAGKTGDMLDARVRDPDWMRDYPKAMKLALDFQWMSHGKLVTFIRPDAVRIIMDGEWSGNTRSSPSGHSGGLAGASDERSPQGKAMEAEMLERIQKKIAGRAKA